MPLLRPANSCSRVGPPALPPTSAPAIAYAGCAAASWRFSSATLSSWVCSRIHSCHAVSYLLAVIARMRPTFHQVKCFATDVAHPDPADWVAVRRWGGGPERTVLCVTENLHLEQGLQLDDALSEVHRLRLQLANLLLALRHLHMRDAHNFQHGTGRDQSELISLLKRLVPMDAVTHMQTPEAMKEALQALESGQTASACNTQPGLENTFLQCSGLHLGA